MAAPDFLKKLGAKPGDALLIPDATLRRFAGAARVLSRAPRREKVRGVVFRPARREDLPWDLRAHRGVIREDGFIWAVIPKKVAINELGRNVTFEDVLRAALKMDLVDNKTLTLTDREYGIRLVVRKHMRK